MANDNYTSSERSINAQKQLRDRKGLWIEMGGGVKWYSTKLKKHVYGTAVDIEGNNAVIEVPTSDGNTSKVRVAGNKIEAIDEKASLDGISAQKKGKATLPDGYNKPVHTGGLSTFQANQEESDTKAPDTSDLTAGHSVGYFEVKKKDPYSTLSTPVKGLKVGDEVYPVYNSTKKYNLKKEAGTLHADKNTSSGLGKVTAVKEGKYATIEDTKGGKHFVSASHHVVKRSDAIDTSLQQAATMEAASIYKGKEAPKTWVDDLSPEVPEEATEAENAPADTATPKAKSEPTQEQAEPEKEPLVTVFDNKNFELPEETAVWAWQLSEGDQVLWTDSTNTQYDDVPFQLDSYNTPLGGSDNKVYAPMPENYGFKNSIHLADKNSNAVEVGTVVKNPEGKGKAIKSAKGEFFPVGSGQRFIKVSPEMLTDLAQIQSEKGTPVKSDFINGADEGLESPTQETLPTEDAPESSDTPEATEDAPATSETEEAPATAEESTPAAEAEQAPAESEAETSPKATTTPVAIEGEKFPPTEQQQAVIDAVLEGKDTLVQAKAGAGKTTTLEAIARRIKLKNPKDQIAYIAFNKSVQLEANKRMPDNVEARTGHSIAHAWAPEWMINRFKDKKAIRRPDEAAKHLGIKGNIAVPDGDPLDSTEQALAVIRTVDAFANSAEDKISALHLPDSLQDIPEAGKEKLLKYAEDAWQDLSSEDGELKLSLDIVRKHWALTRPDLGDNGSGLNKKATILFLDEAQDTPPVLAKVVEDQTMQKVIVGDADQAIYGFTGATDYLSTAKGDVELPLNKSWRFGPAIADAGNRFLQLLKSKGRVIGAGPDSKIVKGMQDPDAILVRTNAGMIGEIAQALQQGKTVGVPAKTKADLQSLIATAKYLRKEGPVPSKMHDDLAAFRNWKEVEKEAAKGDDPKITMIESMIKAQGTTALSELIEKVDELTPPVTFAEMDHGTVAEGDTYNARKTLSMAGLKFTPIPGEFKENGDPVKAWTALGTPEEQAATVAKAEGLLPKPVKPDVMISTAHKAKGLEWDRVKIGNDFKEPKKDKLTGKVRMPDDDELRLAYVAVTRAQKELDPGSLAYAYDFTDENGGDPDVAEATEATPDEALPIEEPQNVSEAPMEDPEVEDVVDAEPVTAPDDGPDGEIPDPDLEEDQTEPEPSDEDIASDPDEDVDEEESTPVSESAPKTLKNPKKDDFDKLPIGTKLQSDTYDTVLEKVDDNAWTIDDGWEEYTDESVADQFAGDTWKNITDDAPAAEEEPEEELEEEEDDSEEPVSQEEEEEPVTEEEPAAEPEPEPEPIEEPTAEETPEPVEEAPAKEEPVAETKPEAPAFVQGSLLSDADSVADITDLPIGTKLIRDDGRVQEKIADNEWRSFTKSGFPLGLTDVDESMFKLSKSPAGPLYTVNFPTNDTESDTAPEEQVETPVSKPRQKVSLSQPADELAYEEALNTTFPDKGKVIINTDGDTLKPNMIVSSPKYGEGVIKKILPSTDAAKVIYKSAGEKTTQAKHLTIFEKLAESGPIPFDELQIGDTGVNPDNGQMFIVGKNKSFLQVGNRVSYTKKGQTTEGIVANIYKDAKSVRVQFDDGTLAIKKASTIERIADTEPVATPVAETVPEAPQAPVEAPSVPETVDTLPEFPDSLTNPTAQDLEELPIGSKITSVGFGTDYDKYPSGLWVNPMAQDELDSEEIVNGYGDDTWNLIPGTGGTPPQKPTPEPTPEPEEEEREEEVENNVTESELFNAPTGSTIYSPLLDETFEKDGDGDWVPESGSYDTPYEGYYSTIGLLNSFKDDGWTLELRPENNLSVEDLESVGNYSELYNGSSGQYFTKENGDWINSETGTYYQPDELLDTFPSEDWSLTEAEINEEAVPAPGGEFLTDLPVGSVIEYSNNPTDSPSDYYKVDEDQWWSLDYDGQPLGEPISDEIMGEDGYIHVKTVGNGVSEHRLVSLESTDAPLLPEDITLELIESMPRGTALQTAKNSKVHYVKTAENSWKVVTQFGKPNSFAFIGTDEQMLKAKDQGGFSVVQKPTLFEDVVPAKDVSTYPVDTFVPMNRASTTGFQKLSDDQWDFKLTGESSGQIVNDAFVQAVVDKNDPQTTFPSVPETTVTPGPVSIDPDKPLSEYTEAELNDLPTGTKIYRNNVGSPFTEAFWSKNVQENSWTFNTGEGQPSSAHVSTDHLKGMLDIESNHPTFGPPVSEVTEESLDGKQTSEITKEQFENLPIGTALRFNGSGLGYVKDAPNSWEVEGANSHIADEPFDGLINVANDSTLFIELPKDSSSTPAEEPEAPLVEWEKALLNAPETPEAIQNGQKLSEISTLGQLAELPIGTKLKTYGDIYVEKEAENVWRYHSASAKLGETMADSNVLSMANSDVIGPTYTVDLPDATLDGKTLDNIVTLKQIKDLPVGTLLMKEDGMHREKRRNNEWATVSPNGKYGLVNHKDYHMFALATGEMGSEYTIQYPKDKTAESVPVETTPVDLNGATLDSVVSVGQIAEMPVGTTLTKPNGVKRTKVGPDAWQTTLASGTASPITNTDAEMYSIASQDTGSLYTIAFPAETYTSEHENALQKFKTNSKEIGDHLRGIADNAFPNAKEIIYGLDDLIKNASLDTPTKVYRGFKTDNQGVLDQLEVGNVLRDKSFASTSTDIDIAQDALNKGKGEYSVMVDFDLPAGFHAAKIDYDKFSDPEFKEKYSHEDEVLLPRLFDFEITDVVQTQNEDGEPLYKVSVKGVVKDAMDGLNNSNVNQIDPTDPKSKRPFKILDDPGADGDGFHASGPWGHFGASGVLVQAPDPETGEKKYLIVENGPLHETQNQGLWQLPGGAVNGNENPYEGAAREMNEELAVPGATIEKFTHAGDVVFANEDGWKYTNIAAKAESMFDVEIDVIETSDSKWVTAEELNEMANNGELLPAFAKNVPSILDKFAASDSVPSSMRSIGDFVKSDKNGPTGSNYGAYYTEINTGNEYYVKSGMSLDHARDEVLASMIYQEAGINSAKQELINFGDANIGIGIASKLIDNMGSSKNKLNDPDFMAEVQKGFAIDALVANWDVAGLGYDNLLVDMEGKPLRIDPGASLRFRAQGSKKSEFNGDVKEWEFLRTGNNSESSSIKPTATLFGEMDDMDLTFSATKLAPLTNSKIDSMVDSVGYDSETSDFMKKTLKARRDDIIKRAGLDNSDVFGEDLDESETTAPTGTQEGTGSGSSGSVPLEGGPSGDNGPSEAPATEGVTGKNGEVLSVGDNIIWESKGIPGTVTDINPEANKVQMQMLDGTKKWYSGAKMVKSKPLVSESTVAPSEDADPSDPLYNTPAPVFEGVFPEFAVSNIPEGFVEHIEKRYVDKVDPSWSKASVQQSFYWSKVEEYKTSPNKETLDFLHKKLYVGDDMYQKALDHAESVDEKKKEAQKKYDDEYADFGKKLKAWQKANGVSGQLTGAGKLPPASTEDWTPENGYINGNVDWSKGPVGSYTVDAILEKFKVDGNLAIHGVSAMVDAKSIVDNNIRFSKVVGVDGKQKIQATFEISPFAKNKAINSMSEIGTSKHGISAGSTGYDSVTGFPIFNTSGDNRFAYLDGQTFTADVLGTSVRLQVSDNVGGASNDNASAFNALATITMESGMSGIEFEQALKAFGIDDAHPSTKDSVEFNKRKRLVSFFNGHVADQSVQFENNPGQLEEESDQVLKTLGYELDDFKLVHKGTGFYDFLMPKSLMDKLTEDSGVKALVHTNMDYVSDEYNTKYDLGSKLDAWKESKGVPRLFRKLIKGAKGFLPTAKRILEGDDARGMSPEPDLMSGGSRYLFTTPVKYLESQGDYGPKSLPVASKADSGVVMPGHIAFKYLGNYANANDNGVGARKTGNKVYDTLKNHDAYEAMIKNGVGIEDTWYVITNAKQKPLIVQTLKEHGTYEINGIPVDEYFVIPGVDTPPIYIDKFVYPE